MREDVKNIAGGEELEARQQSRCKDVGLAVLGIWLHEAQIEAIWTLRARIPASGSENRL